MVERMARERKKVEVSKEIQAKPPWPETRKSRMWKTGLSQNVIRSI
jgi:hypothetical protein